MTLSSSKSTSDAIPASCLDITKKFKDLDHQKIQEPQRLMLKT